MKVLDTSVVVDIDRGGVDRKVRKLDEQGRHLLSMVSATELRLGVELQYEQGTDAYATAIDQLDRLLARFDIHPVSRSVATTAAELIATRREQGQSLDDLHDIYAIDAFERKKECRELGTYREVWGLRLVTAGQSQNLPVECSRPRFSGSDRRPPRQPLRDVVGDLVVLDVAFHRVAPRLRISARRCL